MLLFWILGAGTANGVEHLTLRQEGQTKQFFSIIQGPTCLVRATLHGENET